MSKTSHKEIKFRAKYLPQDKIRILGTDTEGIVVRLGSAGDIEYIHVQIGNNVLTFRDFQIEKVR